MLKCRLAYIKLLKLKHNPIHALAQSPFLHCAYQRKLIKPHSAIRWPVKNRIAVHLFIYRRIQVATEYGNFTTPLICDVV